MSLLIGSAVTTISDGQGVDLDAMLDEYFRHSYQATLVGVRNIAFPEARRYYKKNHVNLPEHDPVSYSVLLHEWALPGVARGPLLYVESHPLMVRMRQLDNVKVEFLHAGWYYATLHPEGAVGKGTVPEGVICPAESYVLPCCSKDPFASTVVEKGRFREMLDPVRNATKHGTLQERVNSMHGFHQDMARLFASEDIQYQAVSKRMLPRDHRYPVFSLNALCGKTDIEKYYGSLGKKVAVFLFGSHDQMMNTLTPAEMNAMHFAETMVPIALAGQTTNLVTAGVDMGGYGGAALCAIPAVGVAMLADSLYRMYKSLHQSPRAASGLLRAWSA